MACIVCQAEVGKLYEGQATQQGQAKLHSCLTDLGAVSSRFKDVLDFGFSQLHVSAVKPRVKPWVDTFLTTSHNLQEVLQHSIVRVIAV